MHDIFLFCADKHVDSYTSGANCPTGFLWFALLQPGANKTHDPDVYIWIILLRILDE